MNINAFSKFSSPWMGSRGVSWYLQRENGEARPPMARLTGQTTVFNYISEDLVMIQRLPFSDCPPSKLLKEDDETNAIVKISDQVAYLLVGALQTVVAPVGEGVLLYIYPASVRERHSSRSLSLNQRTSWRTAMLRVGYIQKQAITIHYTNTSV